jgi:hypothetical protein
MEEWRYNIRILNLGINGVTCSTACHTALYPVSTEEEGDGPRGGLDVLKKWKISWPAKNRNIPWPVTSHYTKQAIRAIRMQKVEYIKIKQLANRTKNASKF